MTTLLALGNNPTVRMAVLAAIFILVAGAALMISRVTGRRHVTRQRLLASAHAPIESPIISSLRVDQANAAWVRLVNRIEKAGLSLVDTKDDTLKRNLAELDAPHLVEHVECRRRIGRSVADAAHDRQILV